MELVSASVTVITKILETDAINVGVNLGSLSGASVPGHLHVHIIPRWKIDDSFLGAIGQTRLIAVELQKVYELLKPHFNQL